MGLVMRPVPLICAIVGVVLGVALLLDGMVVVAMYSYSSDGAHYTCTTAGVSQSGNASIRDRTAGLGIMAGGLAILLSVGFIVIWVASLILDTLNHGLPNWILAAIMLALSLLQIASYTVAWALMAKDINDFQNTPPGTSCDTPGGWSAGIAFALFGFLGWIGMAILVVLWAVLLQFLDSGRSEG